MEKLCKYCNTLKSSEEFHKNPRKKDGLADRCKLCRRIYHKEHYERNKQIYISKASKYKEESREYIRDIKKDLICENCGESRWWVLDFHHKDPAEKEGEVTNMVYWSKERIDKEISKCSILCSNCHRDLHFRERENARVV